MRSYGQYCAVAKTLDVIGDRWNLLIIRELLLQGPCRYTDLQHGLPGIATNLLADRLRDLERAGVVYREQAPPPVATTLFALTERGAQLRPVMVELARWGLPLMRERGEQEAFRSHWIGVIGELYPFDLLPEAAPAAIELRAGDGSVTIEVSGGRVSVRAEAAGGAGGSDRPDLVLAGSEQLILGVITGVLDLSDAATRGLRWHGDPDVLTRLRPAAQAPEPAAAVIAATS